MHLGIVRRNGGSGQKIVEYVSDAARPIGHVLQRVGWIDATVPALWEEAGSGYLSKLDSCGGAGVGSGVQISGCINFTVISLFRDAASRRRCRVDPFIPSPRCRWHQRVVSPLPSITRNQTPTNREFALVSVFTFQRGWNRLVNFNGAELIYPIVLLDGSFSLPSFCFLFQNSNDNNGLDDVNVR